MRHNFKTCIIFVHLHSNRPMTKNKVPQTKSRHDYDMDGNFCPDFKETCDKPPYESKVLLYVVWAVTILTIAGSCIYAIKTLWI